MKYAPACRELQLANKMRAEVIHLIMDSTQVCGRRRPVCLRLLSRQPRDQDTTPQDGAAHEECPRLCKLLTKPSQVRSGGQVGTTSVGAQFASEKF
jgi:hypothetical protein